MLESRIIMNGGKFMRSGEDTEKLVMEQLFLLFIYSCLQNPKALAFFEKNKYEKALI